MRARLARLLGALMALAALAAATAPAAPAREGDGPQRAGRAAITLTKPARKALRRGGVKLRGWAAAECRGARLVLPVRSGAVRSSVARVNLRGVILLRAGKRRVKLREPQLNVVAGAGNLTARLGRYRYTVSRLRGVDEVPFNPIEGWVRVSKAKVRLTGEVRRLLRQRLRGARPPRALGRLRVNARVAVAPPDVVEPDPLERPATAVDVGSVEIAWRARESLVCYVHAGGGPGISVDGVKAPAVDYPPDHESVPCSGDPGRPLPYTFIYPTETASGWYDPESETAYVRASGAVRFRKDAFRLDVTMSEPEVELAGERSRLIHTYYDERGWPVRRGVTADLPDLRPCAPGWTVEQDDAGDWVHTIERAPGRVPDGATKGNFARFYFPGDDFGWVTVRFVVPAEAAGSEGGCG